MDKQAKNFINYLAVELAGLIEQYPHKAGEARKYAKESKMAFHDRFGVAWGNRPEERVETLLEMRFNEHQKHLVRHSAYLIDNLMREYFLK